MHGNADGYILKKTKYPVWPLYGDEPMIATPSRDQKASPTTSGPNQKPNIMFPNFYRTLDYSDNQKW